MRKYFTPEAIIAAVALLVMLLAAVGFVRKPEHAAAVEQLRMEIESVERTQKAAIDSVKMMHAADMLRVEKKLDCALFGLPDGCRRTMSPR